MKFSKKSANQQYKPMSERDVLKSKFLTARLNLLVVVAFTFLNVIMALTASDTYLLFSASIPYYAVYMGMLLCDKFPPEYYDEFGAYFSFPDSFLIAMIIVAVVILALYLLCWFMSKKHYAWLIVASALFVFDILGMFWFFGFDSSMILDIVFHAWVMYYLIVGVKVAKKLESMPEEPIVAEPTAETMTDEESFNSGFDYDNDNKSEE